MKPGLFIMGGYWAYILYSDGGDVYYKGSSAAPEVRLIHHNTTEKGYTSLYRPWRWVFRKEYPTKAEAQAAERRLKKMKSRSSDSAESNGLCERRVLPGERIMSSSIPAGGSGAEFLGVLKREFLVRPCQTQRAANLMSDIAGLHVQSSSPTKVKCEEDGTPGSTRLLMICVIDSTNMGTFSKFVDEKYFVLKHSNS